MREVQRRRAYLFREQSAQSHIITKSSQTKKSRPFQRTLFMSPVYIVEAKLHV